jgi:hypothetical protein
LLSCLLLLKKEWLEKCDEAKKLKISEAIQLKSIYKKKCFKIELLNAVAEYDFTENNAVGKL